MASINGKFLNKTTLKKVNAALKAAGYLTYPGDKTTAQPEGCGSGYVSNLVEWEAGANTKDRKEVETIVENVLRG